MRYRGPAKLLSEAGEELGDVVVVLDKAEAEGRPPWNGLVETTDRSSIDNLVKDHAEGTLVLPDGRAGIIVIRRLTIDSPIAAIEGSGRPPF